jgi:hypothetical protein
LGISLFEIESLLAVNKFSKVEKLVMVWFHN